MELGSLSVCVGRSIWEEVRVYFISCLGCYVGFVFFWFFSFGVVVFYVGVGDLNLFSFFCKYSLYFI